MLSGTAKGNVGCTGPYPELHDGPGVGSEAGCGRGGAASRGLIRVTRVVVVPRVTRRHGRRRVTIKNDIGIGRNLGKVDDMDSHR